ncbi:unnamed protein product [Allacma fusca]|uniref:Uncharacterized protein n=1 Tax=Allacma fusca TaxID=39272 RepID=A0A8J2LLQ3_9HEXA|nr:unnamed protein product [Allacma fusca]
MRRHITTTNRTSTTFRNVLMLLSTRDEVDASGLRAYPQKKKEVAKCGKERIKKLVGFSAYLGFYNNNSHYILCVCFSKRSSCPSVERFS